VPEVRSEDELADILWANVANFRLASHREFRQLEHATLTNFEILVDQWQSMEPVNGSPYSMIPTIGYHSSYPVETFIKDLEGAFGPDALSRIHQRVPKVGEHNRTTCNIIDVFYRGALLVDEIILNTLYIPVQNPKRQRMNKSPIFLLKRF
jgi:hypothetical protein